jgi:signal transduction histidine kinase
VSKGSGESENTEKLHLRPKGRMVKILGEHLIRDNTVGVMELIKNGYDADAENVLVELRDLADPSRTEIIIADDGTGMTEATIKGPWSEPAHGGKQEDKDRQKTTKKGRRPLGEKGVGRFAAQKLGRYLDMITRPENEQVEYHVSVDWDTFDRSDTYIDEVGLTLEKRKPVVFTGTHHGTRLEIREPRIPWRKSDVEKLQGALIKLLSPTNRIGDFVVQFVCPDYEDLQSLDRGDILEKYQFKIDCRIDDKGKAKYTYLHRFPDGKVDPTEVPDSYVWSNASEEWEKYNPACGPLRVVIYAWLRKASNLESYAITKAQLDALSGIGIYRDGFRVLPYGDTGEDWLGLQLRRTNQPGEKYGINQVVGMVEITQDKNRELIDKTNREGLQENQAYTDMKDMVLVVVSILETESIEERAKQTKPTESVKELKAQREELKKKIEELENRPQKVVEMPVLQAPATTPQEQTSPQQMTKQTVVEVPIQELQGLKETAEEVDSAADEAVQELSIVQEDKREAFLHLMGIGLAAERFTHEFDRLTGILDVNLKSLEKVHPLESPVRALRRITDVLKNEVALISVARYVRKEEAHPTTSVKTVIGLTFNAHEDGIEASKIQVDYTPGPDFVVEISTASLSQVIDNIVANAIYWLGSKTEVADRKLSVVVNPEERSIIISDNGAPLAHHIKKALFREPFITSKPNGRGLGLYISHQILKEHKASIEFLDEKDSRNKYGGTAFILLFQNDV